MYSLYIESTPREGTPQEVWFDFGQPLGLNALFLQIFVFFRQDKQNEVLVTNSLLNEKQMELEQIRGAVKREEHKSEQEGERVMGVCRESGQVMLAINNLHSR